MNHARRAVLLLAEEPVTAGSDGLYGMQQAEQPQATAHAGPTMQRPGVPKQTGRQDMFDSKQKSDKERKADSQKWQPGSRASAGVPGPTNIPAAQPFAAGVGLTSGPPAGSGQPQPPDADYEDYEG